MMTLIRCRCKIVLC